MFLSNLRIKSPISKKMEKNIFDGMASNCLNIVSKQFKHHFNLQNVVVNFEN